MDKNWLISLLILFIGLLLWAIKTLVFDYKKLPDRIVVRTVGFIVMCLIFIYYLIEDIKKF